VRSFTWVDGERTIVFGPVAGAVDALGGPGYTLLTTERAAAAAPGLAEAAGAVHHVGAGQVHELAGDLRGEVSGDRIVALGGGRVIDVAKALAAAAGGTVRAMAVPTTLSGAEMTRGHRHARGVDESTPRVRAAVVVFDPALAASQPVEQLAASTLNALGHAVEGPCTVLANPVATLAAHEAARLLTAGWAGDEPDRELLALGALLAGYTIDSTGLGLHHVLAQTLVRVAGTGHGAANAALLPHTIGALGRRAPEAIAALNAAATARAAAAADGGAAERGPAAGSGGAAERGPAAGSGGAPAAHAAPRPEVPRDDDLAAIAARIAARANASGLRAIGVDPADLDACAEAAAARPQLANTPPAADRAEILALYERAL
jgi:alcohol dehydrogenase class IV